MKDFKPSYQMNHGESDHFGSNSFSPSAPLSTQKPKTVIKIKKQEVKKIKLITPGLKHYATVPKYVARNDYTNYFRSRGAHDEHREALAQHLYRRNPRALLVPQYAPDTLNYFA